MHEDLSKQVKKNIRTLLPAHLVECTKPECLHEECFPGEGEQSGKWVRYAKQKYEVSEDDILPALLLQISELEKTQKMQYVALNSIRTMMYFFSVVTGIGLGIGVIWGLTLFFR